MRSILLAKACAESQIGQIYCGSDMSPSLEWVPSLKLRGYLSEVRLMSVGPHGGPIRERERERVLYLYTATSKQVLRRGG